MCPKLVSTSCGAWVDVVWLSRSSTALGAGVRSTWRKVSAPGTDSASAEFLSACFATGLEKKNYLFHTVTLAFMIRILDHFFRVWPWLLSHFTAFESFPEAYSQFLLYHFGKSWKLQVNCQFCFYYVREASRGLINTWLRCLYLLELFYSFVDKNWSVYRKFMKEDLFESCSHFNIRGFVGSSEQSACLQNIESFMPGGMRIPQDILAAGFSGQLSAQELTAGLWCRASHAPQALQLPWTVLWEHWLGVYLLSVMAVIWLVHVRSVTQPLPLHLSQSVLEMAQVTLLPCGLLDNTTPFLFSLAQCTGNFTSEKDVGMLSWKYLHFSQSCCPQTLPWLCSSFMSSQHWRSWRNNTSTANLKCFPRLCKTSFHNL